MKKKLIGTLKKMTAGFLTAAMCMTSISAYGLESIAAAPEIPTPAQRDDASIVYFVDCGDYTVNAVNEGDQLGTHNSVTDQVYGVDEVTGYEWGIIDSDTELTGNNVKNGTPKATGGVNTANTWAFEYLSYNEDHDKTDTNRYSKNFFEKGIEERYVDYAFELEKGKYEVTVNCANPWDCSNSPVITAKLENANQNIDLSKSNFSVPNKGNAEKSGIVEITENTEKVTVDIRGTGNDNKAVNVAYILIKSITDDEEKAIKDKEELSLPEIVTEDLNLPAAGSNGSKITWISDTKSVITNKGKITRPPAGTSDASANLTATISYGTAKKTVVFHVTVKALEPEESDIVYFVDCGDYTVNTVSDGDQFGSHNSVTDQVYGEDAVTGYQWGIVDTETELTGNNVTNKKTPSTGDASGAVYTANTWANENLSGTNLTKLQTSRYTKNFFEKGIAERYLDYKFELENGKYDITVCCVDPWSSADNPVSQSPNVYLNYGKDTQFTFKEGLDATINEAVKRTYKVTDGELTVNLRATGDKNKAINLAYILIKKHKDLSPEEEELQAKQVMESDYASLNIENTEITSDIDLITEGKNGSAINWRSSDEAVISNTGKVTRPAAGSADASVTLTAVLSYNNFSMEKVFALKVLAENDLTGLEEFSLSDVQLEDDYYNNITEMDVDFLNKFDPDRLLYNFRLTAGYAKSEIEKLDFDKNGKGASSPYPGGWENSRIGGHTMGHYLAAAAQAIADGYGDVKGDDDYSLSDRLDYIIDNLEVCQTKLGTGFIFGATMANMSQPEKQFDIIEGGKTDDTWVPWYTMHKIVNGLVETYKLTGNEKALTIAENLGEWIYKRTSKWNDTVQKNVLRVEYGGMNDCLYELYKFAVEDGYTNADHFSAAAHSFDEDALFEKVLSGQKNALNGLHANCTIPKFMGSLNHYRALGDEKYLQYAEAFWTLITEKHSYITGGNSECEFFGADNILDAERSHCNCETCNTHNMLKLTRELYRITGNKKYADYYENTFINAIMASVNEETGMTTYFQPMATGFFKVYCNPDLEKNYFWCCTGTGLENFTKLGDSFYFHKDDKLIVNQYTSSSVTWKNVKLKQETDIPNTNQSKFTVSLLNGASSAAMDLRLRIPDWTAGAVIVKLNGTVQDEKTSNGYVSINRTWSNGDTVEITLPMTIRSYTLPDNSGTVYGFKYGPVVLAAELGTDNKMDTYQVGVQCDVCKTKIVNGIERTSTNGYGNTSNQGTLTSETLNIQGGISVSDYMDNINEYLIKDKDSLKFTLTGTDWGGKENLTFTPYYRIHNQRYGIYWLFEGISDPAKVQEAIKNSKETGRDLNVNLSGVGIGYGAQTEGDANNYPHMEETGEGSTPDMAHLTRYANAGGSFSYLFKVDKTKKNYISCQYSPDDNGKTMVIKVGDTVIATDTLDYDGTEDIFTVRYEIPDSIVAAAASYKLLDPTTGMTETRDVLRISFSGAENEESPKLYTSANTSTNYNNNAGIAGITSDIGTVGNVGSDYCLEVPKDTKQVQIKVSLADKYGLLYMDDVLIDDTKAKNIDLESEETKIAMKVFAEDHETNATYQLTIVKKDKNTNNDNTGGNNTGNDNNNTEDKNPIALQKLTLNKTSMSMSVGETFALKVTYVPSNASNQGVIYSSSNDKIVSVNKTTGKMTAKKKGSATITATSTSNNSIKATCKITVKKPSLTISGSSKVKKGKSIKLKAKLKNLKGTPKWSVNNKKLAVIKGKGTKVTLKAKKKGTVKVTVKVGSIKKTKKIKITK